MNSTKFKFIAAITLMAFVFASGCATLFPPPRIGIDKPDLSLDTYKPPTNPPIQVVVEEVKPYVKQVLRKGQVAQMDGIQFDKDSSKRILADLAELKELRKKVQIQGLTIAAYEEQRGLLREANNLMAASNEQYRKTLESQQRWKFLKGALTVVAVIAAVALGIYGSK